MDAIPRQADLTKLEDEMELAHFANKLYWSRKIHNREASAEYQHRQERIDQIRKEMDELKARKLFPQEGSRAVDTDKVNLALNRGTAIHSPRYS